MNLYDYRPVVHIASCGMEGLSLKDQNSFDLIISFNTINVVIGRVKEAVC